MNKKKWYIGKVSAEGDRVFTFQATDMVYINLLHRCPKDEHSWPL